MESSRQMGFPSGGGAMGAAIRDHDWSASPLGAKEGWPPALRNTLNLVLNSQESMFVMWGAEQTFFFNDAYRPMLGPRLATALGRDIAVVWADTWDQVLPVVERALAGEGTRFTDVPLTMARYGDEEQTWWTFSFSPLHDDDGRVAGMLGITRETTEKVLADRRQRFRLDLEDKLRILDDPRAIVSAAIEALGMHLGVNRVGYGEMQADGRTVRLVSGFERGVASNSGDVPIDGFGEEAADRQRRGLTVLSPDITAEPIYDAAAWAGIETRAFVSVPLVREGVLKAILYVNQKDARRWSPADVTLIEDVAARVWDAVGRAQAERAMRESESQFSTLTQAMPNQVWTATPLGAVNWANDRTVAYSGRADLTQGGEGWTTIVHPDDLAVAGARWAAALQSGATYEVEFRIRRADGAFRWHLVRAVAQRNASGAISRWVGTNTDIDDQKRAELDLADAKRAAEEANLAKSTFIANMSHELRTPLSAIIGYSEMMLEEIEENSDAAGLAADMRKVEGNARHLLGLINDVLDLSKVESGKMEVYAESVDVAPMLQDIANTVGSLIGKKGNRLALRLDEPLGAMHSDLTKVRQILLNLLSNAAKFTEGGTITLSARRDGPDFVFAVADTGIGMTDEQLTRLFQRFQQADASTTRRFGGSGLGLSLAKAFADMLGGAVSVASVSGEGSTFTLRLPAIYRPAPDEAPSPGIEPEAQGDVRAHDLVLVIDDDLDQRTLMTRFLTREKFRVQVAADGRTGLDLARKLRPQAILLDVMMPGIDGWSVLSALKADPELAAIPVVMVTSVDQRNLAASLGAADYMMKPVRWDRFSLMMDRFRTPEGGILLIEDDAAARLEVRSVLEDDGWTVAEASNGREGLAQATVRRPEVVLLDLTMPVMDGFDFLQALRELPGCAEVPVIVLTGRKLTRDDRSRLRGASQILNKGDLELRDLVRRLHQLTESQSAPTAV